jgi:putative membrane protein
MLSPADHERVHAAIAAAEAKTTGELYCVVAHESAAYREVPLAWAAGAALLGPPIALVLGVRPGMILATMDGGWVAGHAHALEGAMTRAVIGYAVVQAVLFGVVLLLVGALPWLRRLLTPGFVKREHVHARALEQFAHRRHISGAPTSVLIYASTAERRVEIVADEAIHQQAGEGVWADAMQAALAKIRSGDAPGGLIAAIERCGAALARHFPAEGAPRPEPDDDLTEV